MEKTFPVLLTNSSDIYAGGEFFVLQLAQALSDRGHRVVVCCRPDNLVREKCSNAGIMVEPVDFPPQGRLLHFTRILRSLIRKHGAAIIHTNTNYDRTAGAFAARWAGIPHVTNVHSFHSLLHNPTHWIRNKYAVDRYLVDGVCVRELLVREDGIDADRISVVYLGVDPKTMVTIPSLRERIRSEFSITPDEIVIGTVGRLVPFKGHEYLLRAFPEIANTVPEARLLLVGDGELHEHLGSLARELGVRERVAFAGFRDDLQALYSAFDIYCHPSVEGGGETFPFAVLQALAHALPVVATRVGDVAVMVEEGMTGMVVADRNSPILSEAIVRICSVPGLRKSMGDGGRNLLENRLTLAKMTDSIEAIYSALIAASG